MFCPNCGNDCADANFCLVCGSAVFLTEETDAPALSVGRYEGLDGYIELSYYTVKIHKDSETTPTESVVAYDDITDVLYKNLSGEGIGYFAIAHIDQKAQPVRSEEDAACDETALLFSEEQSDTFQAIYSCLKKLSAEKKSKRESKSKRVLRKNGICCPKCGSQNFTIYRFPRYIPPAIKNPYTRLISNLLILYSVFVLEGKKMKCLDCGNAWFP